jgi:hypothetical protein
MDRKAESRKAERHQCRDTERYAGRLKDINTERQTDRQKGRKQVG